MGSHSRAGGPGELDATALATAEDRPLTWRGVRTVASLELRRRTRTSRWPIVLTVWAVVVYGVALLSWAATSGVTPEDDVLARPVVLYGVTLLCVLGLCLMIMPSFTASSVNGDREHGVLAMLQTTLLSPAEIVLGKLLASWALAGVFVGVAAPVLLLALVQGGVGFASLVLALVCLAIVLACVCALGLMYSALAARPVTSVLLTYLTVGFLVFGTLVLFAATAPLTTSTVTRQVWVDRPASERSATGDADNCQIVDQQREETRTDRIWWLLAANPFVVVADAAPPRHARRTFEPLGGISEGVRSARQGPVGVIEECFYDESSVRAAQERQQALTAEVAPVWPIGLTILTALGAGATVLAIRRLATPVGKLPRGARIA